MTFKKGERNEFNEIITEVHSYGPDFIIYEVAGDIIRYHSSNPEMARRFVQLSDSAVRIPYLTGKNHSLKSLAKDGVIQALTAIAHGDSESGTRQIELTILRLIGLRQIGSKLEYLSGSISLILALIVITIFFFLAKTLQENALFLLYAITCGSLGSFLSVMLNLSKLELQIDVPPMNIALGASRVIIGIVSAILAYLLMKANLLFGVLAQGDSQYAILVLCTVAGFSETLIPNVMRSLESRQGNKK